MKRLTIFVGPNGSGKTNLLELLFSFFKDFELAGGNAIGFNEYSWWKRETRNPIEINLMVELERNEIEMLPKEFTEKLETLSKNFNILEIHRQVKATNVWITKQLRLGGLDLVKEDKQVSVEEVNKKFIRELRALAKVYHFDPKSTPQTPVGPRLIILGKTAYHVSPKIDEYVKQGILPCEKVTKQERKPDGTIRTVGVDYKAWCTERGYKLEERAPTDEELRPHIPAITPQTLQNSLSNIRNILKNAFILIPVTRDIAAPPGERKILPGEGVAQLPFLTDPKSRSDVDRYEYVCSVFEELFGKTIFTGTVARIRDKLIRDVIPIALEGGGIQEVLGLLGKHFAAVEAGKIIGLEEPEMHLHPDLAKKLFRHLKDKTEYNQLILTTHSANFIDTSKGGCNFMFAPTKDGAKVEHKEGREIVRILGGLGAEPRIGGAPNKMLFVEGPSDKEFIEGIAEKLGAEALSFITLDGIKSRRVLERVAEAFRSSLIELCLIVDKGREEDAEHLKKRGIMERKNILILARKLEDLYPIELVKKASINLGIDRKDIKELNHGEIYALLREKYPKEATWKIGLASYIAKAIDPKKVMSEPEDFDKEFVELIRFIDKLGKGR